MLELKSKVLNFTFAYIVLTIVCLLFSINKIGVVLSIVFLLPIVMLISAIYYINAVMNNSISYLKAFKILIFIYEVMIGLKIIEQIFRMLLIIVYSIMMKDYSDRRPPLIYIFLSVVITIIFISFGIFIIYYRRFVNEYYNQIIKENNLIEKNRNYKIKATKSKVLKFTYIFIVLTAIIIIRILYEIPSKLIILIFYTFILILELFYIRAIKNNNISNMIIYESIIIVYGTFMVFISSVPISSILLSYKYNINTGRYKTLRKKIISTMILIVFNVLFIYYITLVNKYIDVVKKLPTKDTTDSVIPFNSKIISLLMKIYDKISNILGNTSNDNASKD
ncbi:hypothetical protein BCR32DRAFT_289405 [Anaeromyces robustus]|uniref:Uncharacterized protein n=1 Tax=Anaeromyces robustus TaxID=1754192 RepID=A0A1Y1XPN5_9FUNG|nr:hypothetical protein BCR32DRAFT_289405 [Anaeromyces robustus]|eukprot:ORX87284.1 hypothetical protein BCR32DRAFT_289405 [Anaeromyces robustus]